ncbi:hypothetical protein LPJ73_008910, partial [Coemansia sp. RSA 2703]
MSSDTRQRHSHAECIALLPALHLSLGRSTVDGKHVLPDICWNPVAADSARARNQQSLCSASQPASYCSSKASEHRALLGAGRRRSLGSFAVSVAAGRAPQQTPAVDSAGAGASPADGDASSGRQADGGSGKGGDGSPDNGSPDGAAGGSSSDPNDSSENDSDEHEEEEEEEDDGDVRCVCGERNDGELMIQCEQCQ